MKTQQRQPDKFSKHHLTYNKFIQKSLQNIERVSLEAQVEGLTAQKEALVQAYSTLEDQFKGQSAEKYKATTSLRGSSSVDYSRVTPRNDGGKDFEIKTKRSALK